jgi:hypothetical protein
MVWLALLHNLAKNNDTLESTPKEKEILRLLTNVILILPREKDFLPGKNGNPRVR